MKRLLLLLTILAAVWPSADAVLKEENLDETLGVLRLELVKRYGEMSGQASERRIQNKAIQNELMETISRNWEELGI